MQKAKAEQLFEEFTAFCGAYWDLIRPIPKDQYRLIDIVMVLESREFPTAAAYLRNWGEATNHPQHEVLKVWRKTIIACILGR